MKIANPTHVRIAAGVAAVFLATALGAATPRTTSDAPAPVRGRAVQNDPAVKHADKNFIEKAAKSGLEEVEISRVAATRTSNPDVKRFAQMIIADHESAHEELGALASMKGVNLPAKENADRWTKRDAKSFDREYIDKMVGDHEDTVKMFEKHAKDGTDVETVAFARKHLPKLQSHLQQASDLKRMLKNR